MQFLINFWLIYVIFHQLCNIKHSCYSHWLFTWYLMSELYQFYAILYFWFLHWCKKVTTMRYELTIQLRGTKAISPWPTPSTSVWVPTWIPVQRRLLATLLCIFVVTIWHSILLSSLLLIIPRVIWLFVFLGRQDLQLATCVQMMTILIDWLFGWQRWWQWWCWCWLQWWCEWFWWC